ncbi:MAG: SWIM zinc finger family protein, partial [Chromatocurvus sp.]
MRFSYSDIKELASGHISKLGDEWFREGRVTTPSVQRGGEIVSGLIRDQDGKSLRVYVRTTGDASTVTLRGECSCRRRINCEHMVALLLQALQDHAGPPQAAGVDHSVCAPGPGIALRAGVEREWRSRHVLLYLLHLDDQGPHLEPVVARLADSGDYRLGRSYHIPRSRGGTPPGFLQPSNLDLLPWLRDLP